MSEPRGSLLPLSDAQLGIWFAHQFDPTRQLYYFADYAEIVGRLDVQALDTALRRTVAETDALNVRFVEGAGGALDQVVEPQADWSLTEVDVSSAPDPQAAALAWMRNESGRRIDLARDPLFESAVIKLGPDRHYWYWAVHHIAMDGYGMALVITRACEIYRALRAGETPPAAWFGRLRDLLDEEAAARKSERHERDRAYWAEQFADRPRLHALGSRPAVGAHGRFESIRAIVPVPPATLRGLQAMAERLGGGWTRFAIAAAGLYVHHVREARDATVSLSIHRRLTPVAKRTPCTMANVLPLRLALAPGMTLSDYAAHAFAQTNGALKHHGYRGERLRKEIDPAHRALGYFGPLVNIVRVDYRIKLDGVEAQIHNLKFPILEDLTIGFEDRGDNEQLLLHVIGSSASRTREEVDRHADRLCGLVAALAAADSSHPVDRMLAPASGNAWSDAAASKARMLG